MAKLKQFQLALVVAIIVLASAATAQAPAERDTAAAETALTNATRAGELAAQRFAEARALEQRGELKRAYGKYREAFALDAGRFRAVYRAGRLLHEFGKLDNALAAMRRAVAIEPEFYPAHNALGLYLVEVGELDAAVEAFQRAAEVAPDLPAAWRNLARALAETGALEGAVRAYERALETDPGHEPTLAALTDLNARLSERAPQTAAPDTTGAGADTVAAADEPAPVIFQHFRAGSFTESGLYRPAPLAMKSPLKLRRRGIELVHDGNYRAGIDTLQQAIRYGGGSPELFSELGYARFQLGEYEAAAWAYGRAAETSPQPKPWHRLNQAIALREAGDLPGAEKALKRALALDPALGHAHYLLGLVLLELDRLTAATRAFRGAVRLEPGNLSAQLALAATVAAHGREEDAIETYRLALLVQPGEPEALYQLTGLLERNGRPAQALAACEALAITTEDDPRLAAWNEYAQEKMRELAHAASLVEPDLARLRDSREVVPIFVEDLRGR